MKLSYKGCGISISPLRKEGELFIYDRTITVHTDKSTNDHQISGKLKSVNKETAINHIIQSSKQWIDDNVQ